MECEIFRLHRYENYVESEFHINGKFFSVITERLPRFCNVRDLIDPDDYKIEFSFHRVYKGEIPCIFEESDKHKFYPCFIGFGENVFESMNHFLLSKKVSDNKLFESEITFFDFFSQVKRSVELSSDIKLKIRNYF